MLKRNYAAHEDARRLVTDTGKETLSFCIWPRAAGFLLIPSASGVPSGART